MISISEKHFVWKSTENCIKTRTSLDVKSESFLPYQELDLKPNYHAFHRKVCEGENLFVCSLLVMYALKKEMISQSLFEQRGVWSHYLPVCKVANLVSMLLDFVTFWPDINNITWLFVWIRSINDSWYYIMLVIHVFYLKPRKSHYIVYNIAFFNIDHNNCNLTTSHVALS